MLNKFQKLLFFVSTEHRKNEDFGMWLWQAGRQLVDSSLSRWSVQLLPYRSSADLELVLPTFSHFCGVQLEKSWFLNQPCLRVIQHRRTCRHLICKSTKVWLTVWTSLNLCQRTKPRLFLQNDWCMVERVHSCQSFTCTTPIVWYCTWLLDKDLDFWLKSRLNDFDHHQKIAHHQVKHDHSSLIRRSNSKHMQQTERGTDLRQSCSELRDELRIHCLGARFSWASSICSTSMVLRPYSRTFSLNYCPWLFGPRSRRDSTSTIQQWICPELHHLESPISCWRNDIELSIYRCSNYWSVSHLDDNRYQHSF